jgi:hypothetical protein
LCSPQQKRKTMNSYLSQTDLGKMYGVTAFRIGKWLIEAGMRGKNGIPTAYALRMGITQQRPSTNPGTYYWVWSRDAVIEIFHDLGYEKPRGYVQAQGGAR